MSSNLGRQNYSLNLVSNETVNKVKYYSRKFIYDTSVCLKFVLLGIDPLYIPIKDLKNDKLLEYGYTTVLDKNLFPVKQKNFFYAFLECVYYCWLVIVFVSVFLNLKIKYKAWNEEYHTDNIFQFIFSCSRIWSSIFLSSNPLLGLTIVLLKNFSIVTMMISHYILSDTVYEWTNTYYKIQAKEGVIVQLIVNSRNNSNNKLQDQQNDSQRGIDNLHNKPNGDDVNSNNSIHQQNGNEEEEDTHSISDLNDHNNNENKQEKNFDANNMNHRNDSNDKTKKKKFGEVPIRVMVMGQLSSSGMQAQSMMNNNEALHVDSVNNLQRNDLNCDLINEKQIESEEDENNNNINIHTNQTSVISNNFYSITQLKSMQQCNVIPLSKGHSSREEVSNS